MQCVTVLVRYVHDDEPETITLTTDGNVFSEKASWEADQLECYVDTYPTHDEARQAHRERIDILTRRCALWEFDSGWDGDLDPL